MKRDTKRLTEFMQVGYVPDRMIKILRLSGVYLLSFNRKGLNGWNYYKIIDTISTQFYAYERYRLNDRE